MSQKPTFGPCILCIVPAWYSVNVNRIVGTVAPCRTIRTIPGSLRAKLVPQSTRWTKRWFTGFIAEVTQWTGIVRVIRNAWEKNINDQCGPILVDFIFNLNSVLSYNSGSHWAPTCDVTPVTSNAWGTVWYELCSWNFSIVQHRTLFGTDASSTITTTRTFFRYRFSCKNWAICYFCDVFSWVIMTKVAAIDFKLKSEHFYV